MNNEIRCEKCGHLMRPFKSIGSTGMECPNCGWGWATTYNDPIDNDKKIYTLLILKNLDPSIEEIKIISKLLNINFIETKNKLQENDIEIMGNAKKIREFMEIIKDSDIKYTISPEFHY